MAMVYQVELKLNKKSIGLSPCPQSFKYNIDKIVCIRPLLKTCLAFLSPPSIYQRKIDNAKSVIYSLKKRFYETMRKFRIIFLLKVLSKFCCFVANIKKC